MPRFRAPARTSSPERLIGEDLGVNACLRELSAISKSTVVKRAAIVTLAVDDRIYTPGKTIDDVFFPIDCVLSVVTRMQDGSMIEVGTIGREGNSAIPLLLGARTSANECFCQVPGRALRMSTELFSSLRNDAGFTRVLDRFVQAYVNMLGQLAACNWLHSVYQRCARWLLLTHDRVGADSFYLTQEYLAMMLGAQRSGVTIAAATLQRARLISYGRGVIQILDRPGLELASCECYGAARNQFLGIPAAVRS